MVDEARGTLRRWGWRAVVVVAVIVALVAFVATRGSAAQGSDYRTALVGTGDVSQTLTTSGTIESASRYDATFQTSGTVASVSVKAGDTVAAGQLLATLDDTDLLAAVTSAEDALTRAKNTLEDDLAAQAAPRSSSGSSSTPSGQGSAGQGSAGQGSAGQGSAGQGSGGQSGAGSSSVDAAAEKAVTDAQSALLTQYDVATAALNQAKADAAAAQAACAAFAGLDPTDPTVQDALTACQDATATAASSQQAAADAQSALMDAVDALNRAVSALTGANATSSTPSAAPSATPSAAPSTTPSTTSAGAAATVTLVSFTRSGVAEATGDDFATTASGGTSGAVPSAEDILADRADVTEAEANLAVAQGQLDYANLTTPVAGTVVAVGLAEADAVTAGDTSTVITVIADNTYLVNLSVTLTQARLLEVGQPAALTLLSDNQVVDGTVSSVSNVNSGNSFQQSYAVTIAVPDPGFAIRIGTATRMRITVAQATDVLAVPTSAVSDASGDATVKVLGDDGTPQTVSVTTGAVGAEYTEITSGLEEGQTVVLADLTTKLSTGEDSSTGGLLSGLGESTTEDRQFPDGFQLPDGFPAGGFGGGTGGFGGPPSG